MITTTTPSIEGRTISAYLGIVTGEAILGANIFKDLFAGIRDIVGGRSGAYEQELAKARAIALEEMTEVAASLGADAIVGIDLDYETVGESKIELVQPTDDTTGVARFLTSNGEGFHHVCFEVDDLAETLLRLVIDGLELIDSAPRRGAEGPVAFIHPRSCPGVLVELIEAPGGPSWDALGYETTTRRSEP